MFYSVIFNVLFADLLSLHIITFNVCFLLIIHAMPYVITHCQLCNMCDKSCAV